MMMFLLPRNMKKHLLQTWLIFMVKYLSTDGALQRRERWSDVI